MDDCEELSAISPQPAAWNTEPGLYGNVAILEAFGPSISPDTNDFRLRAES
jgi:hypothetical protein